MTPPRPIRNSKVLPAYMLVTSMLVLSGCEFRPDPLSAVAYNDNEGVVVQVTIRASDADTIKRRELYVRLNVINCDGTGAGFPADPPIEGGRIPGYDAPIQSGTMQITGRVPTHIYAKYSEPCVFLNGGGYFSGTIESSRVRIVRDPGTGPNNSFKPKPLRGSA